MVKIQPSVNVINKINSEREDFAVENNGSAEYEFTYFCGRAYFYARVSSVASAFAFQY